MLLPRSTSVLGFLLLLLHVNSKSIDYTTNYIGGEITGDNNSEDKSNLNEESNDIFSKDHIEIIQDDLNNVGLNTETLAIDLLTQWMKYFKKQLRRTKFSIVHSPDSPLSAKLNLTEIQKLEENSKAFSNLISKLTSANFTDSSKENSINKNSLVQEKNTLPPPHKIKTRSVEDFGPSSSQQNPDNTLETDYFVGEPDPESIMNLARTIEEASQEIFDLFGTRESRDGDSQGEGILGTSDEKAKVKIVPLKSGELLQKSIEKIAKYVVDNVGSSVENLSQKLQNFSQEATERNLSPESNIEGEDDKSNDLTFEDITEGFNAITESTLQEIHEAIEKIVPQNITHCIDNLVGDNTINFQQFSIQLIKALQSKMANTTEHVNKEENNESVSKEEVEEDETKLLQNFDDSSNETISEIYKGFYNFLIEFAQVSKNTTLKNATTVFLKEARNKFGNIFNLNSAEEAIEDNPIYSVIAETLRELQEGVTSPENSKPQTTTEPITEKEEVEALEELSQEDLKVQTTTERSTKKRKVRSKRQVRIPEERRSPRAKEVITEAKEELPPKNNTRPNVIVPNANKKVHPTTKPREDHLKTIPKNATTEKPPVNIARKADNEIVPVKKERTSEQSEMEKLEKSGKGDEISPRSNNVDRLVDFGAQDKKCLQYEGEDTVGQSHVEALKKEVEKLQHLVSILKQEERILEDINEKSKRLNDSLNADSNRDQLMKMIERLSNNRNMSNKDLFPQQIKIEQRIGEDMWLPNTNTPNSEIGPYGIELGNLKQKLRRAELSLNETIMALEKEVLRDNLMELELNDQKLEINLLKSMLKVLLEKQFHGDARRDHHNLDFNKVPAMPDIRNTNSAVNTNNIDSPSEFFSNGLRNANSMADTAAPVIPENNFATSQEQGLEFIQARNSEPERKPAEAVNKDNSIVGAIQDLNQFPSFQEEPVLSEMKSPVAEALRKNDFARTANDIPLEEESSRNPEARDSTGDDDVEKIKSKLFEELRHLVVQSDEKKHIDKASSAQLKNQIAELEDELKKQREQEEMRKQIRSLEDKIKQLQKEKEGRTLNQINRQDKFKNFNFPRPINRIQNDEVIGQELKNLQKAIDDLRPKEETNEKPSNNEELNGLLNALLNSRQTPTPSVKNTLSAPTPASVYGPPPASVYGPPPASVYAPPPASLYAPPPAPVYGPPIVNRRPLPPPVKMLLPPDYELTRGNYQQNLRPSSRLVCSLEPEPLNYVNNFATSYEKVPYQAQTNVAYRPTQNIAFDVPKRAPTPIPYVPQRNIGYGSAPGPYSYAQNVPQRNLGPGKQINSYNHQSYAARPQAHVISHGTSSVKTGVPYAAAPVQKHYGVNTKTNQIPYANGASTYQSSYKPEPVVVQNIAKPQEPLHLPQENPYAPNFFPPQPTTRVEGSYQQSYSSPTNPSPNNLPNYSQYSPETPTIPDNNGVEINRLRDEISSLQSTVNSLNKVDYGGNPDNVVTIKKLQEEINDVNNMIRILSDGSKYYVPESHSNSQGQNGGYSSGQAAGYEAGPVQSYDGGVPAYSSRKSRSKRQAVFQNGGGPVPAPMVGDANMMNSNYYVGAPRENDIDEHLEEVKQRLSELRQRLDSHTQEASDNPESRSSLLSSYPQPYPLATQPSLYSTTYPVDGKSANYLKNDWFTDLIGKLVDKVLSALPVVFKKLFDFIVGQFSSDASYYGDGYGDKYSSEIQNLFKNLGIFGIVPAIILKLVQGLTSFIKILQRNKFVKTFLVPALIVGLVAGSVVFLVWWLSPDDDTYGYLNGSGYGQSYDKGYGDNYGSSGTTDYSSPQYTQKLASEPVEDTNSVTSDSLYKNLNAIASNVGAYTS